MVIKNSAIRKILETAIFNSTSLFIDFNEEGGGDNSEFIRIDSPLIISDIANIGATRMKNDGTVSIQVFTQSKARCIEVYDEIASGLNIGNYLVGYDSRLHINRVYTDFYGKDSVGSYYQLNFNVDFVCYT